MFSDQTCNFKRTEHAMMMDDDDDDLNESIFDFIDGNRKEGKKVLTAQRRSDNRRKMKEINDHMKDMKKKNVLKRACQKRDKFSRPRRHRQSRPVLRPPVSQTHKDVLRAFSGNNAVINGQSYQVYNTNYCNWQMKREEALAEARRMDEIEEKELEEKREAVKEKLRFRTHKNMFQPVLRQICQTHVDTDTAPIEEEDEDDHKDENLVNTTMDHFFATKGGRNQKRVEREYKELYYFKIWKNPRIVNEWPDTIMKKLESVTLEQNKKKALKCVDCDTDLVIDRTSGECICTTCGLSVKGGDGIAFKQTFQQLRSSSRAALPYVRISHVSSFVGYWQIRSGHKVGQKESLEFGYSCGCGGGSVCDRSRTPSRTPHCIRCCMQPIACV